MGSPPISRVLAWATIPLGPSLPTASSSLPGSDASHAITPLFGLAPDEVCHAVRVTTSAVGSYSTGSPLPDPLAGPSAVCFLLHCLSPWASCETCCARPLAGILLYGARTFLQMLLHIQRLPSRLPDAIVTARHQGRPSLFRLAQPSKTIAIVPQCLFLDWKQDRNQEAPGLLCPAFGLGLNRSRGRGGMRP